MQLKLQLRIAPDTRNYLKFSYSWNGQQFMIYIPRDQAPDTYVAATMILDLVEAKPR